MVEELSSWRCSRCGEYYPGQEESTRQPKISATMPYSTSVVAGGAVTPFAEEELVKAKQVLDDLKARMPAEEVEKTLGVFRFAGQREVYSIAGEVSLFYNLGNGHALFVQYAEHRRSSGLVYDLCAVRLDDVVHWVNLEDASRSD